MISLWQSISLQKALIAQITTRYAILAVSNKEILNKAIEVAKVFVAAVAMLNVTIITPVDVVMVETAEVAVGEAVAVLLVPLMVGDQSLLILTFHPLNGML
jgi:ABC-type Co2+ transport system permease subunit